MKFWLSAAVAAMIFTAGVAGAQSEPASPDVELSAPEKGEKQSPIQQFISELNFRDGTVTIPEANATLQLTDNFRYLDKADARRVLEELWGNAPDDTVLGLLVPTNAGLASEHSWAVMLTWSDDGYVSDEDAAEIDYDELLASKKAAQEEANPELAKAGYPTGHLLGWARPPRYDATNKRLYWAQQLQFDDSDTETLNYDIRVLGREGHLSMNAISAMDDFERVDAGMNEVLAMAHFDEGHRYADFNSSTDRTAAYGLAALVGGGLAAKTGILAKFGAMLALIFAKLGKAVILLFAAAAAGIRKLFKKKDGTVQ